jgi:C1A family cysteine protease
LLFVLFATAVSKFIPQGMGWIPDLPDPRDYTYRHKRVLPLLHRLKRTSRKKLPDSVDLRCDDEGEYFTPPVDQGPLNSSSACAAIGLVEYFERRVRGRTFEGSKLFLYKVTRNCLQKWLRVTGDTGADLRTTLKVLVRFGVPPEEHWPDHVERYDAEPSQFLYSLAKPFSGVRYFRLDEPNCAGHATWATVRSFLAAGFPIAFGLSVPTSLTAEANIPYRPQFDSIRGGQAAVAVGYKNNHFGARQDALLIRSSWGCKWGDHGYGLLPCTYVRNQLARDFWTIVDEQWLESNELSRPSIIAAAESASRKTQRPTNI